MRKRVMLDINDNTRTLPQFVIFSIEKYSKVGEAHYITKAVDKDHGCKLTGRKIQVRRIPTKDCGIRKLKCYFGLNLMRFKITIEITCTEYYGTH